MYDDIDYNKASAEELLKGINLEYYGDKIHELDRRISEISSGQPESTNGKVYEGKEKKKDTYIQTSIPLNFEEKKSVVEEEIKKIDINNYNHSNNIANNIMRTVQENYETSKYITIKFQE